jgi:hypothetical protein
MKYFLLGMLYLNSAFAYEYVGGNGNTWKVKCNDGTEHFLVNIGNDSADMAAAAEGKCKGHGGIKTITKIPGPINNSKK